MGQWKQETGDEILQVDSLRPGAAPDKAEMDETQRGLKRTTAGQEDRESPPPSKEGHESPEGPGESRRDDTAPDLDAGRK
jgi:hypothetical protein